MAKKSKKAKKMTKHRHGSKTRHFPKGASATGTLKKGKKKKLTFKKGKYKSSVTAKLGKKNKLSVKVNPRRRTKPKRRSKGKLHSHRSSVRHLRKGATASATLRKGKAKLRFGKGKKRVVMSARVNKKGKASLKVNPEGLTVTARVQSGFGKNMKPIYKKVGAKFVGKRPTKGEYYASRAAQHLNAEKAKRTKSKAAKAKATKLSKTWRKKSDKAAKRRAVVGGAAKLQKALAKNQGYKTSVKRKLYANPPGGAMLGKADQIVKQYTGHGLMDLGSLALGGGIYGAVNGVMSQKARPVYDALQGVPFVGPALPNLLVGVLMAKFGRKSPLLGGLIEATGQGMVGAAAVAIGTNVAQAVPFLTTLKGADFGSLQHEAALMGGADFGHAGQMGGINYSPMSGIDYTMSGIDYTMDGSDFGVSAEGLAGGQMG